MVARAGPQPALLVASVAAALAPAVWSAAQVAVIQAAVVEGIIRAVVTAALLVAVVLSMPEPVRRRTRLELDRSMDESKSAPIDHPPKTASNDLRPA